MEFMVSVQEDAEDIKAVQKELEVMAEEPEKETKEQEASRLEKMKNTSAKLEGAMEVNAKIVDWWYEKGVQYWLDNYPFTLIIDVMNHVIGELNSYKKK